MFFDGVDGAFEDIDKVRDYLRIEGTSLAYDVLSVAEETLKEEFNKRRWIPVSERLPNSNGCYLVWRPHFFGGEVGMPSICYFDGQDTWHDSFGVDFNRVLSSDDVIAWMPLPEPYMEGEEDNADNS